MKDSSLEVCENDFFVFVCLIFCFRLFSIDQCLCSFFLLSLLSVNKLISISRQRYNIKILLSRVLKNIFMIDIQKIASSALTILL